MVYLSKKAIPFFYTFISFINALLICLLCGLTAGAQQTSPVLNKFTDSLKKNTTVDYGKQRDMIDIAMIVLHKDPSKRIDSVVDKSLKLRLSASPVIEYTLSTGFTAGIAAGGAFFTSVKELTNLSSFLGAIKYTKKNNSYFQYNRLIGRLVINTIFWEIGDTLITLKIPME